MPSNLEGPMRKADKQVIQKPMNMTPLFFIFEVITYINGLVEAYIKVGMAKLNPMNTALYPNYSK